MPDKRSPKYGVKKRGQKWIARPYVNGEHHWVGTFETEDEALRAAMERHDELKRLPASGETVKTFAKRWLTDYPRKKRSTNDLYAGMAKLLVEEYGEKRLREFSRLDARRFARDHHGAARSVRAMFSDALDEGLIEANPFFGLRLGPEGRSRGRRDIVVITAAELDRLIEIAAECHPNFHFGHLIAFAASTTMRPSEVFGLEWDDIDTKAQEIHVRRQRYRGRCELPKNGRVRTIILPPAAAQALNGLPRRTAVREVDETGKERPLNYVFRNKSGDPMSATTLNFYWAPVRTAFEAGLSPERRDEFRRARSPKHPHMDFYETRHFGATFLLEKFRAAGEDGAYDVAIQLGHTDDGELVRTLYTHPSEDLSRQRLKKLFEEPTPLREVRDDEAANG